MKYFVNVAVIASQLNFDALVDGKVLSSGAGGPTADPAELDQPIHFDPFLEPQQPVEPDPADPFLQFGMQKLKEKPEEHHQKPPLLPDVKHEIIRPP